ncbi:MAGE-domain-containing protein [Choiromyces venosus 120613-1]|uniref:MAGE-domain-containing protein n=1 Tax=Choiromyces venosus 120613-1 TaxID=1336337 RepID=A0A3N4K3M7_9PEZI|nr:MAGE-domain-containing protein [Choiromyces venosus 120613-1]
MAPAAKRRAQLPPPDSNSDASPPQRRRLAPPQNSRRNGGESSTQGARRGRPRSPSLEQDDPEDEDASGGEGMGGGATQDSNKDRMIKKLVRYAISAEYTRVPIKRTEISSKVLGSHGRMFKEVFAGAQLELERVFGMKMVELPIREKTKLSQRRAAQTSEKAPSTSKSYVLTTVLPEHLREPEIVQPFGVKEQAYVGLTTMVVSLIYLNGRSIAETKLDRYLRRMNADRNTAAGETEKVLQSMIRHGYISKQKDDNANDGSFDYVLGPRGKVEIGTDGVLSMVKTVCPTSCYYLDNVLIGVSRSTASTPPKKSRSG